MAASKIRLHGSAAAVLGTLVVLLAAGAAYASAATRTVEALALHPHGGSGLELAIGRILSSESGDRPAREIAEEILSAASTSSDAQIAAIGRALAAHARAIVAKDPAGSRAILAVVVDARNAALQTAFNSARGNRDPGLSVPTGNRGGGLDTTSPE